MKQKPETTGINLYREKSLHSALKQHIAQPGDRFEVTVNSYVIDVVRDDQLIEIQTGGFSALKSKLAHLLPRYPIRVIYPVPTRRWIIKLDSTGTELSRRKSPKKGHITEVFTQLVYIPQQIMHDNFSLEVVLVEDAEVRVNDGRGS